MRAFKGHALGNACNVDHEARLGILRACFIR
jgi:hypothetical protein